MFKLCLDQDVQFFTSILLCVIFRCPSVHHYSLPTDGGQKDRDGYVCVWNDVYAVTFWLSVESDHNQTLKKKACIFNELCVCGKSDRAVIMTTIRSKAKGVCFTSNFTVYRIPHYEYSKYQILLFFTTKIQKTTHGPLG